MKNRRQFLSLSMQAISTATLLTLTTTGNAKSAAKTGLVLDSGFLRHQISANHPESPARYQAIVDYLQDHDIIAETVTIAPTVAAEKWLSLVHSQQHITAISTQQAMMHANAILATSGVLSAVDAVCNSQVRNAFCASRPPGHHARNTGSEEGFCYYNHIAIAARYAQKKYALDKVLIIDWDYHHGDGTEWAFYADPSVLCFSTHDMFAYPGTGLPTKTGQGAGEGSNINVHLACGASDTEIISAFKEKLLSAANHFKPDLILISAGFDSRTEDPLGCFAISDNGFRILTNMVLELADQYCQGKLVSILEGGL